jgi:hypothetical protein
MPLREERQKQIKEKRNRLSEMYQEALRYYESGDMNQALSLFKEYDVLKDTVGSMVLDDQLEMLENKYKTEEKDNEIKNIHKEKELLSIEILRKQELINKRNTLILIILIAFIVFSVLCFFLLRIFRMVRKSNKILKNQNEQIEKQKINLEQQSLEIFRQKNHLTEQHKMILQQSQLIAFQNKEIHDSIEYASMIQKALFPDINRISPNTEKHFIVHIPSGNISSAFYWNSSKNNSDYYAVAESANSEIAGAMLTVLGVSLLNELIIDKKEYSSGELLDKLRNNFIRSLHIKYENDENSESLDIALCKINHKERKIEFAGANIPCYFTEGVELKKAEPDFMPIGISNKLGRKFANKQIEYLAGTKIYLLTNSSRAVFDDIAGIGNFSVVFSNMISQTNISVQNVITDLVLKNRKTSKDLLMIVIEP